MSRQAVAQQPPDPTRDYRRFPSRGLRRGSRWFREHDRRREPWYFSSARGRFDLPAPEGTCYLASSAAAAVRERVGPEFVSHGAVPASLLRGRVVSSLALQRTVSAANVSVAAAAAFRVTGELAVMTPYAIPQAWAQALHAAGFGGIVFALRFSPGRTHGLAVFGASGAESGWLVDPQPEPASDVAMRLGLHLVEPPAFEQLRVLR